MTDDTKLLVLELARNVETLNGHILDIKEALAERRGERRVAFWFAGAIGGIAGAALTIGVKLSTLLGAKHP